MSLAKFLKSAKVWQIGRRYISTSGIKNFPIVSAEHSSNRDFLKVQFSDGQRQDFPSLFLQDNCTCPKCYHPSSRSRSRTMVELKLENFIKQVEFSPPEVKCRWDDGHEAVFTENWLKARRFSDDNIKRRKTELRDNPSLIGSDHVFMRENFHNLLENPSSLVKMLKTICKHGVVLVDGTPTETGQLKKLTDKIGFSRLTHYGHEFTVKSEKDAVNLAYTSHTLGVHTDLPYYAYPPGLLLLHCIKQFEGDEGGKSQLVDGFRVAEQMRKYHPEEFKILHSVPVEFTDVGEDYIDFNKVNHSPTFVMSPKTQKITRIAYNNMVLSSYQPISLGKVDAVYKALKLFNNLCYKPENLMEFKLKEGEILVFDNWRLLHGRKGFDPRKGDRKLEGCYIDWDEVFSRIRVLESHE